MSSHSPLTVYDSATEHDVSAAVIWVATIQATPEPALLARILQKAAALEAMILRAQYDAGHDLRGGESGVARVEIMFKAQPARARSVALKWEKIITVQEVNLFPLNSDAWAPPRTVREGLRNDRRGN